MMQLLAIDIRHLYISKREIHCACVYRRFSSNKTGCADFNVVRSVWAILLSDVKRINLETFHLGFVPTEIKSASYKGTQCVRDMTNRFSNIRECVCLCLCLG